MRKKATGWTFAGANGKTQAVPVEWLLRDVVRTVEKGEKLPRVAEEFMSHIAKQLLAGVDVRKELEMQRAASRPRRNHAKTLEIASACLDEDKKNNGRHRGKLTYPAIAKKFDLKPATVQEIFEKFGHEAAFMRGDDPAKVKFKERRKNRGNKSATKTPNKFVARRRPIK